jgi:uncharacterized membrane protein
MSPHSPAWSLVTGRLFYAAAVIFFGMQHLLLGKFATRIMPKWPAWVPAEAVWPYVTGLLLVVAGSALCFEKMARRAALFLGAQALLGAVLLALPAAVAGSTWGGSWTAAGKTFALGGGALIVAGTLRRGMGDIQWLVPVGRVCFSGFLILTGIQHFVWASFVADLVPKWIPGADFWNYFTGVALIAGGVGILIRPTAQLAAQLSAWMIFSWVILLHLPRALISPANANEATALFEALAFSGIALLLVGIPPREPTVGSPA